MLKHTLIHPQINEVLGRAGHHSKVLIADGNYPAYNTLGPNADLICLNLSPGQPQSLWPTTCGDGALLPLLNRCLS